MRKLNIAEIEMVDGGVSDDAQYGAGIAISLTMIGVLVAIAAAPVTVPLGTAVALTAFAASLAGSAMTYDAASE